MASKPGAASFEIDLPRLRSWFGIGVAGNFAGASGAGDGDAAEHDPDSLIGALAGAGLANASILSQTVA